MKQAAFPVDVRVNTILGFFRKQRQHFPLFVLIGTFHSKDPLGCTFVRFCLFDEDAMIWVLAICLEGKAHHELASSHPCGILCLGRTPVHFFDTAQPSIRIQGLTNCDAKLAKLFTPIPLHVELDFGPFNMTLNGLKEQVFELREFAGLVGIDDSAGASLEGSRAELRILHLLSQSRLLRFEHVSQKLVELNAISHWKLA
mmetsp:Transcript_27132/g.41710  ORF Transcript_27132/g.41710 Transcript_27132/m.41710 type:complete len:200 (+) Transcript_27132:1250-1849(+)